MGYAGDEGREHGDPFAPLSSQIYSIQVSAQLSPPQKDLH